jgi:hypothetical protein
LFTLHSAHLPILTGGIRFTLHSAHLAILIGGIRCLHRYLAFSARDNLRTWRSACVTIWALGILRKWQHVHMEYCKRAREFCVSIWADIQCTWQSEHVTFSAHCNLGIRNSVHLAIWTRKILHMRNRGLFAFCGSGNLCTFQFGYLPLSAPGNADTESGRLCARGNLRAGDFAQLAWAAHVILGIWHSVHMTFCGYGILRIWHSAHMAFCAYGIRRIWHSAHVARRLHGILRTRQGGHMAFCVRGKAGIWHSVHAIVQGNFPLTPVH